MSERTRRLEVLLRNIINFAQIQRKASDAGGKAMFWAAIDEANKFLEETNHAIGTQKRYRQTAKEFYHD